MTKLSKISDVSTIVCKNKAKIFGKRIFSLEDSSVVANGASEDDTALCNSLLNMLLLQIILSEGFLRDDMQSCPCKTVSVERQTP